MTTGRGVLTISVVVLLAATAGRLAAQAAKPVATGSIVGLVLGVDGKPAEGVTVTAQPDAQKMRLSPQATTGPDGRYEMTGVPEGDYNLKFTTDDARYFAGKSVSVFADDVTQAGTVRLKPR